MTYAQTAYAQGFRLESPVKSVSDLGDLIDLVTGNLLQIAIPIAVLMYIWAGIQFMISRGNSAGVQKGKNIMLWTSVGLAILLIGSGFVSLIQSIINLG